MVLLLFFQRLIRKQTNKQMNTNTLLIATDVLMQTIVIINIIIICDGDGDGDVNVDVDGEPLSVGL